MIGIFSMCLLLCWCFEKTKNLTNCILCHFAYNACLVIYDWSKIVQW